MSVQETVHLCPIREVVKLAIIQTNQYANNDVNRQLTNMTKLEIMDRYLDWHGEMVGSVEVCSVVKQIFGFDLDEIPILSTEKRGTFEISSPLTLNARLLIDSYLNHYAHKCSGADMRRMIEHFFGVNLDGVVALENKRISLFSKGLWVVRHKQDLFRIYTGLGDIDVRISATDYFTAQTGLKELPSHLQQALLPLGYTYEEDSGSAYFTTCLGQPVPDSFKGRTIGILLEVIDNFYSHL